jgi:hypothetical protein
MMRGEHDADTRDHRVELSVGERQRLGVGLLPAQFGSPTLASARPASNNSE